MIKPGTHHWNAQQRVIYSRAAAEAVSDEVEAAGASIRGRCAVPRTLLPSSSSPSKNGA
jgi:hypothetical protein